ncbi:MAG TPA: hypothetical protein VMT18_02645 [Planctomycetota bacterium]|nr:hypothetical protein [Planctomycetota bacterium]
MKAMDERDRARERADARATWPVRKTTSEEQSDDLSAETTATERIAMMWPLALEAWRIAGRPLPDYARHEAPIRRLEGPEE